jgi:hypothetical protein
MKPEFFLARLSGKFLFLFFLFLSLFCWAFLYFVYPKSFTKPVKFYVYYKDNLILIKDGIVAGKCSPLLFMYSRVFQSIRDGKAEIFINHDTGNGLQEFRKIITESLSGFEKYFLFQLNSIPSGFSWNDLQTRSEFRRVKVYVRNKKNNPQGLYLWKEQCIPDSVWMQDPGKEKDSVFTMNFLYELKNIPDTVQVTLSGKTIPSVIKYYASGVPVVPVSKSFPVHGTSKKHIVIPPEIRAQIAVPDPLKDSLEKYCFFYVDSVSSPDSYEKNVYFRTNHPSVYLLKAEPGKVRLLPLAHAAR